nr:PREDICTED: uncharacterized protein LOC104247305 isoform X1 [Nicotiana sylvestris]
MSRFIRVRTADKARSRSSEEEEGLPAFGLKNDNNKQKMLLQGNGTQSKAKRDRGFGAEASFEPATSIVPGFGKMVSPLLSPSFFIDSTSRDTRNSGSHTLRNRASTGVDPFRAEGTGLADMRSAFEEAQRLHFVVSFGTGLSNFASSLPYWVFFCRPSTSLSPGCFVVKPRCGKLWMRRDTLGSFAMKRKSSWYTCCMSCRKRQKP